MMRTNGFGMGQSWSVRRYYPDIQLAALKKTTKNLSEQLVT
jgi:hypothetical protein